jgi:hypothetical protein
MAILKTGQDFASGDQVTSQKLMDIVDLATFDDPSDNTTIQVDTNTKKLKVPDNGITSNELLKDATDNNNRAVTTDHIKDLNVTTAKIADKAVILSKIEDLSTAKVLGRTTAGVGVVEQVDIKDEDDFVSDSNTALATQQSIKAYIQSYVAQQVVLSEKIVASARITITAGTITVNKSHGFLAGGITKSSAGTFVFRFDNAQADDDYIVVATRTHFRPFEGDCVVTGQTQDLFKIVSSNDNSANEDPEGLNVIVLNYT